MRPNKIRIYLRDRYVLTAFIMATIVGISTVAFHSYNFPNSPHLLHLKVTFAVAMTLLGAHLVNASHAASLHDKRGGFKNPYLWLFAFNMGYFWSILMVIFYVSGPETLAPLLIQWGLGGILFGVGMALLQRNISLPKTETWNFARFDSQKRWRRAFSFCWPLLVIALIVGNLPDLKAGKTDIDYVLFIAVFMGTLVRPVERKTNGPWYSRAALIAESPQIIGILILIGFLYWQ